MILDGDPTVDARHLYAIASVVHAGRDYDRAELDALAQRVADERSAC